MFLFKGFVRFFCLVGVVTNSMVCWSLFVAL